ncbi:MAG: 4-hydroxybenzoate octaprenyltransferase [Parvibaculaceae bacterium]|nr:4-hydroxybenzoate octaprenyltransferase [Parvibaculaceae bacterium]
MSDGTVADAVPANWVDLYAPAWARPYLRLARADRPIGTWLLLWPCWWSIALAAGQGMNPDASLFSRMGLPNPLLMALFAVGAFVMRGAGCTYNDIVDRDFDASVARTRSRPIPSGAVSVKQALAFLTLLCLTGLVVLLCLNPFSVWLGAASLLIVAAYPFMKRITYWPQAVLGLAFNWGALLGWTAVTGSLSLAPVLLYAGSVFWTIGYDTIYAHQDKEDDTLIGVKSTALRFGASTRRWLLLFYGLMVLALVATGLSLSFSFWYYLGVAAAAAQFGWQIARLDIDNPDLCLRLFRTNRDAGLIIFVAILMGKLTAA